MGQLSSAKERFERRNSNAAYLSSKLKGFKGLVPQKQYEGTESSGYYKYAAFELRRSNRSFADDN